MTSRPTSPRAARAWASHPRVRLTGFIVVTTIAVLGYLGHGRWFVEVRPGGALFDDRVLPTFYLLSIVAALVALRWPLAGEIVATLTVAGLVPFARSQLEPGSAAIVVVGFALPAAAWLWIAWADRRRDRERPDLTRRDAIATILGVGVAAASGVAVARYVVQRIWGPTHPGSRTAPRPNTPIDWIWCGAVTSTACAIRARPREPFGEARLIIAENEGFADATPVEMASVYDRVIEFVVSDLEPGRRYWYAVELDGVIDRVRSGTLRTFPEDRTPLRLIFACCARTGSNGSVFDAIRAERPDLYVCIGDFHYGDNFVDDVDDYRQVLDVQLTQPAPAELYASTPIAYVWDDHDYGPNDSDMSAPGRPAAMAAYREYVPHYDLAGPDSAIFQAFSVGTIRIVLTDARSARDPASATDTSEKSMLGREQLEWLLDELATSALDHDLVVWANPVPWIADEQRGSDSWGGYTHERRRIAEHIDAFGIDNLLMVSGDAHMVAIDDGTNTNYSSTPGPGFPLIHVAALDRSGSVKGGPYTQGPIAGGGHYAAVDVAFTADRLDVELRAMNWQRQRELQYQFSRELTV